MTHGCAFSLQVDGYAKGIFFLALVELVAPSYFQWPLAQLFPEVRADSADLLSLSFFGVYDKQSAVFITFNHRYLKNIDCLSFVVCPLLVPHLPRHFPFFAAAINSTNEANKAGDTCH